MTADREGRLRARVRRATNALRSWTVPDLAPEVPRRRVIAAPLGCPRSWYGHLFAEVVTGELICLRCAATATLTDGQAQLSCYSWYGHHMKLSRDGRRVFCRVCAHTSPVTDVASAVASVLTS